MVSATFFALRMLEITAATLVRLNGDLVKYVRDVVAVSVGTECQGTEVSGLRELALTVETLLVKNHTHELEASRVAARCIVHVRPPTSCCARFRLSEVTCTGQVWMRLGTTSGRRPR